MYLDNIFHETTGQLLAAICVIWLFNMSFKYEYFPVCFLLADSLMPVWQVAIGKFSSTEMAQLKHKVTASELCSVQRSPLLTN